MKAFAEASGAGEFENVSTQETLARMAEAGLAGAVVGGGITVPVAGAGFGADIIQGQIDELKKNLQLRAAVDADINQLRIERRTPQDKGQSTDKIDKQLADLETDREKINKRLSDIVQTEADKAIEDAIKRTATEEAQELTPEVAEQVIKDLEGVGNEVVSDEIVLEQTLPEIKTTPAELDWADWAIDGIEALPDEEQIEFFGKVLEEGDLPRIEGKNIIPSPIKSVNEDVIERLENQAPAVARGDATSGQQEAARIRSAQAMADKLKKAIEGQEVAPVQAVETTEATTDEIIQRVEEKLAPVGPSQPVRKEILRGRLTELNDLIKDIDVEVLDIDEQIVEKEKGRLVVGGNKPKKQSTKRLESRKKKLLKQREDLDSQRDTVIKVSLINEIGATKPISKERIKFLSDEQRFAVITEEANLILEELEQGQQGERIIPEKQQELSVEQDQDAFGVKSTNPPYLFDDLDIVGKRQGGKKVSRRSKSTVMNAVRNIISNPNEQIEVNNAVQQALRQRLFDLINDRIEGDAKRFQPGAGQFEDPFRSNNVLEEELENLEAGKTTIKSGLGTKGRRPETDTSGTTESKIETQRIKDQLAAVLDVNLFRDADIPSGDIIKVKAKVLEDLDKKSLEAQERALNKGFAQGARATKKNIKQMKRNLKDLLNSTSLPTASKNRIIALAKLNAEEDLISNLSEIKSMIANEIEAVEVARLKTELRKLLKKTKPKKVNGKLVGGFTSEIQERFEEIRAASKATSNEQQINKLVADMLESMQKIEDKHDVPKQDTSPSALEELNRRLEESQKSLLDPKKSDEVIDPLVNLMLQYKANPRTVGSAKLQELVDGIKTLMEEGKTKNKEKLLARQLEVAELVSSINSFISKGKDLKSISQVGTRGNLKSGANFGLQVLSKLADGWAEILTRVLPERLVNKLDITKEVQEEKGIRRRLADELVQAAVKAFGKNGMNLQMKLIGDDQIQSFGQNYINNRGESRPMDFSVSQIRKLYMEYQDLSLRETLTGEEQMAEIIENTPEDQEPDFSGIKGNAYPTTFLTSLFDKNLTAADKQYAEAQLRIYNKFYNEVNAVYSEVNGVNLPRIDKYSPISRDVDGAELILDEFGNEMIFRGLSASNPSLEARVGSMAPLKLQSDTQTFSKHIQANARFIALRKKTQIMAGVFRDADMKQRLAIKYGKSFNIEVNEHLESFVNGANHANTALAKTTNFFNRSFGAAVLGLKAKIGFTQLVSYFAYAETIPVTAFISGTKDFVFNFRKAIKILSQSEFIKNRGANVDQDIARIGKVFNNAFLRKVQFAQDKMVDYILIFTKIGDRIPIFMGGWAVYKHVLKTTGSKVKAMDAFEKTSSGTQQSPDIDKLSLQQKGNPLMRGLTMFMSAPIAQYRGETRAIRRWSQGELSNRQTVKRLMIYHFIIPQLYQAVANGILFGEWDKRDQLRAAILGSFNGIPIFGDVINSTLRKIQGKESRGKDLFKWAAPMSQMGGDLWDAMEAGTEGDWEEMQLQLIEASLNLATLVGLPSDAIKNVMKGLQDLEDGEPKAATLRFLGHPSGVIENIE
jgi:hypothetical protein